MTPAELNKLPRQELIALAEAAGIKNAATLTKSALVGAIAPDHDDPPPSSWLGRARTLVARVVEQGLHLPDAAKVLRGPSEPAAAPPPPLPTVTLAEIYAAQGYRDKALIVLNDVLSRTPSNTEAAALKQRLEAEAAPASTADSATDPESAPASASDSAFASETGPASGTTSPSGAATTLDVSAADPAPAADAASTAIASHAASTTDAPGASAQPSAATIASDTASASASAMPSPAIAPDAASAANTTPATEAASASTPDAASASPATAASADATAPPPAATTAPAAGSVSDAPADAGPPSSSAAALPKFYRRDDIVALAVDSSSAYVYWELRPVTFARARWRDVHGRLVIRVLSVGSAAGETASQKHDIDVDELVGDTFVRGLEAGSEVRLCLGWVGPRGFSPLAIAPPLSIPRAYAAVADASRRADATTAAVMRAATRRAARRSAPYIATSALIDIAGERLSTMAHAGGHLGGAARWTASTFDLATGTRAFGGAGDLYRGASDLYRGASDLHRGASDLYRAGRR